VAVSKYPYTGDFPAAGEFAQLIGLKPISKDNTSARLDFILLA
jgi:hypothetical protein